MLFNHFVELIAPFFVFGPRRARLVAGGLIVLFQSLLILSGNLSFQIEHHLFPDVPAHRHAEISEDVRDICERFGVPYNTGPLLRQFGTVVRKIVRLALPV